MKDYYSRYITSSFDIWPLNKRESLYLFAKCMPSKCNLDHIGLRNKWHEFLNQKAALLVLLVVNELHFNK